MILVCPTIPSMEENFRDLLGFHQFKSFSIKEGHDSRHLFLLVPNTLLKQEQDCTQEFATSLGNRNAPWLTKRWSNQFACTSHRLIWEAVPRGLSNIFFETQSLSRGLLTRPGWPTYRHQRSPPVSSSPPPQHWDMNTHCHTWFFYMGAEYQTQNLMPVWQSSPDWAISPAPKFPKSLVHIYTRIA